MPSTLIVALVTFSSRPTQVEAEMTRAISIDRLRPVFSEHYAAATSRHVAAHRRHVSAHCRITWSMSRNRSHSVAHASQISAHASHTWLLNRDSRVMIAAHAVQMSVQSRHRRTHSAILFACSL
jgi:hypothetical protein